MLRPKGPLKFTISLKPGRHKGLVKGHDRGSRGTWFKSCMGAVFPAVLLPIVNWELVARDKGYSTWMQLMGPFSALVPVDVRLIHSLPQLGTASASRVYRVIAAVVNSLWERTR